MDELMLCFMYYYYNVVYINLIKQSSSTVCLWILYFIKNNHEIISQFLEISAILKKITNMHIYMLCWYWLHNLSNL